MFLKGKEMMEKIIVEVGSTCLKIDKWNGNALEKLPGPTIQFKKHYNEDGQLREEDMQKLIQSINELKSVTDNIFVCGTSIFRTLKEEERKSFLKRFKEETNIDFEIIEEQEENELTVSGVVQNVQEKVCVFIGGGGSTELSIYDKSIIETVNNKIGVIDCMEKFPDLAENFATTSVEEVKEFIKERFTFPKEKADILILAGGGHEKFARNSGISYEKNTLYEEKTAPIMMDIETRKKDTEKYFKEISLDEIRKREQDPSWWYSTRAMSVFVLVVAEAIGAKYIVPTNVSMAYGLIKKDE